MYRKDEWPITSFRTKSRISGLLIIIFAIASPFLIQYGMISWFANTKGGSNDGWLGFWGGVIGAIISVAGVVWSIQRQFERNDFLELRTKRPVNIALKFNWDLTNAESVVLFNGLDRSHINELTKDFTDKSIFTKEEVPVLVNATKQNLNNVFVFGNYNHWEYPNGRFIEGKVKKSDSKMEAFNFPSFNNTTALQLMFHHYLDQCRLVKKRSFLDSVEIYGTTDAGEKMYVKIHFDTDLDKKSNIPKILSPEIHFGSDADFPEERIKYLLKERSSYIVNSSAAKWQNTDRK